MPVVNDDGSISLQVAKGGVFSYYEFPWPAEDRLTDEKWRQMLDDGQAPLLPEWTSTFYGPESAFGDFQGVIYRFQRDLADGYWYLEPTWLRASDEVQAQFAPIFEQLAAADNYLGRQWINANYRSFDIQSDDLVVITVRETWQDTLYNQPGDYPQHGDEILGQRGPYDLDVTYTLQNIDGYWQVTRVVFNNEPPVVE